MLNCSIEDAIWKTDHRWRLPCAVSWMDCNWNWRVWKTLFIQDKLKKQLISFVKEPKPRAQILCKTRSWAMRTDQIFRGLDKHKKAEFYFAFCSQWVAASGCSCRWQKKGLETGALAAMKLEVTLLMGSCWKAIWRTLRKELALLHSCCL